MKNILQKMFLFLTVFLFSWGYGQNCHTISNSNIITVANATILNGDYGHSTGGMMIFNEGSSLFTDSSENTFVNLISNLPTISAIDNTSTITVTNIPQTVANSNIRIKISENGRGAGSSTFTLQTYNGQQVTPDNIPSQNHTNIVDGYLTFNTLTSFNSYKLTIRTEKPQGSLSTSVTYSLFSFYVDPPCEQQVITTCNQEVNLINSNFDNQLTASGSNILSNANNVLNDNLNDAYTFLIDGDLTISNTKVFSGGQYVAFELQESSLLDLGYNYRIETLINDLVIESKTFSNAGITLAASGKRSLGFSTTLPFNKIRINGTVVGGATVSIYRAFIIENCTQDYILDCNTNTPIIQNNFSAIINSERSGNSALLTAGNIYENPNNVVDNNPDNYATIFAAAGAAATSSIAVKSLGQTFPGGYFAGFLIENSSLVDLNLLSNIRIKTYRNDVLIESAEGSALGLNLQLLPGTNKRVVGFNTTEGNAYDFDEIVFETFSTADVSLGLTNIYEVVVRKNCFGPDLTCNTDTRVSLPEYPVSISSRTGINGLGVVGQINNADNALNSDPNSYASISITVGAVGSANFAVETGNQIFDGGTFAGFEVES
ncbi:MAG: hypothetical protein KBS93_10385, partial [Flavobacteriaceae bacterium]|nr:hypothetical protein [Candidatus Onthonaster equi]